MEVVREQKKETARFPQYELGVKKGKSRMPAFDGPKGHAKSTMGARRSKNPPVQPRKVWERKAAPKKSFLSDHERKKSLPKELDSYSASASDEDTQRKSWVEYKQPSRPKSKIRGSSQIS